MNERDIISIIENDEWMINFFRTVSHMQLPDWWICAGFVRSNIWDTLYDYANRTPLPDIVVIYCDPLNLKEADEKILKQN